MGLTFALHLLALLSNSLERAATPHRRAAAPPAMSVDVKTTKAGDNKTYPRRGQTVKCHYTGRLTDGTVFDTSRRLLGGFGGIGALEFTIGAGEVIKGWDVGIAKMSKGEQATLTVSPQFGYGKRGIGDIPPNAVLVFDVELLSITGAPWG